MKNKPFHVEHETAPETLEVRPSTSTKREALPVDPLTTRRLIAQSPCPAWEDGVHSYVTLHTGPDRIKRCDCGDEVKRGHPKEASAGTDNATTL